MGGSQVGKVLVEAAEMTNITLAEILHSCNIYLQQLFALRYNSAPVMELPIRGSTYLKLQGIRVIPDAYPLLQFKLFPNKTKAFFAEQKTSTFKNYETTLSISPWYMEKMTIENGDKTRNEKLLEFKSYYYIYGYSMFTKDPDNADRMTVAGFEPTSEILFEPYTNTVFNYVIAGKHVQQFNNSCNKNKRPERCFADCKASIYVKYCNCVPWGLTMDYQTNKLCEDALSCFKEKIGNKFEQCNSLCSFCETVVWRSDRALSSEQNDFPGINVSWTHIKKNTIYPMFQENYKYTAGTFLAEIGGQMDLWIGCSVIGLLHIIIFIGKQIYRRVQHWKKNYKVMSDIQLIDLVESHVPAPAVITKSSMGHKRLGNAETQIKQMASTIKVMENSYPPDSDVKVESGTSDGRTTTDDIKLKQSLKDEGFYRKKFKAYDKQMSQLKMQMHEMHEVQTRVQTDLGQIRSDLKSLTRMLLGMKK